MQCQRCHLVFVETLFLPSKAQEKQEYDKHENRFDDRGYQQFLAKAINAIPHDLKADKALSALDFGCGPAPVLASMLANLGYTTSYYDPIYFANQEVLTTSFDVITCTEAIEHFHHPIKQWRLLMALLNQGGALVIMTKRLISKERFRLWHYKNDPTHVSFFSQASFEYLASTYQLELDFPTSDIVVFRKN